MKDIIPPTIVTSLMIISCLGRAARNSWHDKNAPPVDS